MTADLSSCIHNNTSHTQNKKRQGEAGAGKSSGVGHRVQALLRGRKLAADRIAVDPAVNEGMLASAAARMEGFSGREIAKFMASVQAAVYGSAQAVLTPEIFK